MQTQPSAEGDRPFIEPEPLWHPEQIRIYRQMTPQQKWEFKDIMRTARMMKAAAVRTQHPDWTEQQVQREVARIFLHAHT